MVPKIGEGKPDVIDLIKSGDINFIINVPAGKKSLIDSKPIRSAAITQRIPYITTIEGAQAAISGMDSLEKTGFDVKSIQEYTDSITMKNRKYRHDLDMRNRLWS